MLTKHGVRSAPFQYLPGVIGNCWVGATLASQQIVDNYRLIRYAQTQADTQTNPPALKTINPQESGGQTRITGNKLWLGVERRPAQGVDRRNAWNNSSLPP